MRRHLIVLLLAAMAGPAPAADPPPHAVAFVYHRFGEGEYPSTNIDLARFEAQLDHLAENDYTVWPLSRIVTALRNDEPLPPRTVAITIDDAYRSVYTEAFPRLRARGWPATVFVSTDAVDRGYSAMMTWAQMREMQAAGWEFANHSQGHDHLVERGHDEGPAAWRERVLADLQGAQARLRQELGTAANTAPPLFAYPYGEYDSRLAGLVADAGFVGIAQHSGAIGPRTDWRAVPRFPVSGDYALDIFARRAASRPLPVIEVTPWDTRPETDRPRLTVTVAPGGGRLDALRCYVSGQGAVDVSWPEPGRRFTIRAPAPLAPGRQRYNCTAPGDGQWYWYSHLWLVPGD